MLGTPLTTRNLDSPTFVTSWPGNSELLVVVERGSRQVTLWDLEALDDGPTVIFESDAIYQPTAITQEFIGITGVAFHPSFIDGAKRYIYIRYNRGATIEPFIGTTHRTFVTRYEIPHGKVKVKMSSATAVYTWPTMETGHGSGTLQFDRRANQPNALLYVPMPDHAPPDMTSFGNCCDAVLAQGSPNASDIGRLLSINVDSPAFPVTVEAQGLRNPFGFSVDRGNVSTGLGQGDVWIGDTGFQFTGAIIRWVPGAGPIENYGWPWREVDGLQSWGVPVMRNAHCQADPTLHGPPMSMNACAESSPAPVYTVPFLGFSDLDEFVMTLPPLSVDHDALIGGLVYRGSAVPALTDRYVDRPSGGSRSTCAR